jgi:hypothetical protein
MLLCSRHRLFLIPVTIAELTRGEAAAGSIRQLLTLAANFTVS